MVDLADIVARCVILHSGLYCGQKLPEPSNLVVMQVDEYANGQTVTVRVGQTLQIALPETRTTGFRWVVESSGAPVTELVEDHFEPSGSGPGQAGSHHWVFRAGQAGRASIELRYLRPWETNAEPARVFVLTLTAS